jgi:hypothetical protein
MTIDAKLAWTIFLATSPMLVTTISILGVIVWNLIEVKSIRSELVLIRERLSTLEERDRWTHPQLVAK